MQRVSYRYGIRPLWSMLAPHGRTRRERTVTLNTNVHANPPESATAEHKREPVTPRRRFEVGAASSTDVHPGRAFPRAEAPSAEAAAVHRLVADQICEVGEG